ncbi:TPA: hypothetical protein ACH3X1_014010 [Trebouxia sp. C0004]
MALPNYLEPSTHADFEQKALQYQASFKRDLKKEYDLLDDKIDEHLTDYASKAKKHSFRLPPLPRFKPTQIAAIFMDSAIFDAESGELSDLNDVQQQMIHDSLSEIADGSQHPTVLALTQYMQDDDLYATMLTGDKPELSWRAPANWLGITEVLVILRNSKDILEADAVEPMPREYTLPASLSIEAICSESGGQSAYSLAFQLLITIVDGKPVKVVLLNRSPSQVSKQSLYTRLYDGMCKEHQIHLDTNSIHNLNIGPTAGSPGQTTNLKAVQGAMLEDVVLERHLKCMSVEEFSAFGSEKARGIKMQLTVDLAARADEIGPELRPKPQVRLQEVSELDELEVAGVQPNQEAVAQEILKRILLITGCADQFEGDPAWVKKSIAELQKRFCQGMAFTVVAPTFQTLRQQTLERIVRAGLAEGSSEDVETYVRFRDQVKDPKNENKLFVMIVDECHAGITASQAHDMIVNDFSWGNGDEAQRCKCDKSGEPHPSSGELLSQHNLVTILVSATPYNLLTSKSRLPFKYIFCDPNNAGCTILRKDLATDVWHSSKRALTAQEVWGLQNQKLLQELHVVDWAACDTPAAPHRRIEDYMTSALKPKSNTHGVISDAEFSKMKPIADRSLNPSKQGSKASKDGIVPNVSDYTLMVSYVMSLQYYAIFRCTGPGTDGHPLDLAIDVHQEECRRRVLDTARIRAYTDSVDKILTATFGEDTHLNLSGVGRATLVKAAYSPWIGKILRGEDHSSIVDHAALSAEPERYARLKIWFAYKLQGEQQRHTAGHHLEEDDEVFNETDRVVEAVLRLRFDGSNADNQHTEGSCSDARQAHTKATGNMVVIRVANATVGIEFGAILNKVLMHNSTAGQYTEWMAPQQESQGWQRFEVISDMGRTEQQQLAQRISSWAQMRDLPSQHPALSETGYKAWLAEAHRDANLRSYRDYKSQTMGSRGALQYSDLHGLPCILILCEKGRMGDTFPETFCCLDLRIRTAIQLSTFVQEFGRMCRYPSVVSAPESAVLSPDPAVQHDPEMQHQRIHKLQQALCYAHSTFQAQQPLTMTDMRVQDSSVVVSGLTKKLSAPHTKQHSMHNSGMWHAGTDITVEEWQLRAEALALADSSAFRKLQRSLNAFGHSNAGQQLQHLEHALQCLEGVMGLPGMHAAVQLRTPELLFALLQRIQSELDAQTSRKELWKLLHQSNCGLTEWRQAVLFAWDGLGRPHSDASAAQMSKAVRLFVDGQYNYDLPYALVTEKASEQIARARAVTVKHWLNEAGSDMYAEEVVDNFANAGSMDKFMRKIRPSAALKGAHLKDVRRHFKPTDLSYDNVPVHQTHKQRLLLKAEPQDEFSGVCVGAYIATLIKLNQILRPLQMLSPAPPSLVSQQWKQDWDPLQWRWSYFMDLTGSMTNYSSLRASKYAIKVILQRVCLLAKAVSSQPGGGWLQQYVDMLLSPEGEYVQASRGKELLKDLRSQMADKNCPVTWRAPLLKIVDVNSLHQVLNWDGRMRELMDERTLLCNTCSISAEAQEIVRFDRESLAFEVVQSDLLASIQGASAATQEAAGPPSHISVVHQLAWGQNAMEAVHDEGVAAHTGSASAGLHPYLARTLRQAMTLRPMLQVTRSKEDALEERSLTQDVTKPSLHDLFGLGSSKPRFMAAQSVWKALFNHGQISVSTDGSFSFKAGGDPQQHRIHHWVFVVSYNRFNTKRKDQVLLDWSDAAYDTTAQHAAGYVRVLVIRPEELQMKGYKLLLEEYYSMNRHSPGKQADQWQATMLMVLPEVLNMAALTGAETTHSLSYKLGVGFARLACQVVAWYLDMHSIWLLDDNVRGCWRLDYDAVLQQGPAAKHQQLLPISVTDMMIMIEQQVLGAQEEIHIQGKVDATRKGGIQQSPRDPQLKVGMKGGSNPWTITHSLYSAVLLNVHSTMERGALYPAKAYHEDVDFAHVCDDKQLVAVKCQWLFVHKVNMQQEEHGGAGKGSAKQSPVQISFSVDSCLMAGQLITFKLPAGFSAPPRVQIGNDTVDVVVSDGQECFCCLDVPAPAGTAKQPLFLQALGQGDDGVKMIGQGQELAGVVTWADTEPLEAMRYAPPAIVSGLGLLVKTSQQRQLRTIVDAIGHLQGPGAISRTAYFHISHLGDVSGQIDVSFLEGQLGFHVPDPSHGKASTVLLVNKPSIRLAGAVGEMKDMKQMKGKFFRSELVHFLILQCGAERLGRQTHQSIQQTFLENWKSNSVQPMVSAILLTAPPSQCISNDVLPLSEDDTSDDDMLSPESSTAETLKRDKQYCNLHPYMLIQFQLQSKRKVGESEGQNEKVDSRPSSAGTANVVSPSREEVLPPMSSGKQSSHGVKSHSGPGSVSNQVTAEAAADGGEEVASPGEASMAVGVSTPHSDQTPGTSQASGKKRPRHYNPSLKGATWAQLIEEVLSAQGTFMTTEAILSGITAKSTLHASKREEIKRYSKDYHHWTKADPEVRAKTKATPASNFVSNKISAIKGVKEYIG